MRLAIAATVAGLAGLFLGMNIQYAYGVVSMVLRHCGGM